MSCRVIGFGVAFIDACIYTLKSPSKTMFLTRAYS